MWTPRRAAAALCAICICAALLSGCSTGQKEESGAFPPFSDPDERGSQAVSAPNEPIASVPEDPLAQYTDITPALHALLGENAERYDLLFSSSDTLLFRYWSRSDSGSHSYQLKAVDPNTMTLRAERVIADTRGYLREKNGHILLLEDDRVVVMTPDLSASHEFPVPDPVREGAARAVLVPYNEAGDNPRNNVPRYDISSDFSRFVYTDDTGIYLCETSSGTEELLYAFLPPEYEFIVQRLYYRDNIFAPVFSGDETQIYGTSVEGPLSGGHYSLAATFDLASGELTFSPPYYFSEQYELDTYVEQNLPCAPLLYCTSLAGNRALYVPRYDRKYFIGEDMAYEDHVQRLTQEFWEQRGVD